MRNRARCLSVSRKNEDTLELIDEYADIWGMSFSGAVFYIVNEYQQLKTKQLIRELEDR
tara:strand:+ start:1821 stop:1997 length:177 start_codon:yes stop_codon:yes gene_type:complete